jgi:hypothetical protein
MLWNGGALGYVAADNDSANFSVVPYYKPSYVRNITPEEKFK